MPIFVDSFVAFSNYNFRHLYFISSIHFCYCFSFAIRTNPYFFNFNTFFVFSISNNLDISFINDLSISSCVRIWNWNWNLSSDWKLINRRCWNRNSSCYWNSFESWILNMINIILLIIFLYNRLSNDLFSRNWDLFNSGNVLSLNWFNNWF